MNKIIVACSIVILIILGGFFALNSFIYNEKQAVIGSDYKNAEYIVENVRIQLKGGVSEIEIAPGSASKTTTKYFGNEARHDFNNDGVDDVVFLITQERGGSGTFFYVVAALSAEGGFRGSEAYLFGDRIAPQTTEIQSDKTIVVNYADRKEGEPFTTPPSVGKTTRLQFDVDALQLREVANNSETSTTTPSVALFERKWTWVSALYNDGREIIPKKEGVFAITLDDEGRFSATTDCNSMGGDVTIKGTSISFMNIASTKMYCEGSQETIFAQLLMDSTDYHVNNKGELVLDLKFDSGSVIFK